MDRCLEAGQATHAANAYKFDGHKLFPTVENNFRLFLTPIRVTPFGDYPGKSMHSLETLLK